MAIYTHVLMYYNPSSDTPTFLSAHSDEDSAIQAASSHAENHPGRLVFFAQFTKTISAPPTQASVSSFSIPDAPVVEEPSA